MGETLLLPENGCITVYEQRCRDYEQKREDRVDRLQAAAQRARTERDQLYNQAHRMADVIPLGQPILVGHHSERGDRAYRGRIQSKFEHAMEADKTANYYAGKAYAAASNHAISSDDPAAIEKLKEKLERKEAEQKKMVAANKVVRSKLADAEKIEKMIALGVDPAVAPTLLKPDFCNRLGYPDYALQNNNAEIKRLKQRIERLHSVADDVTTNEKFGDIEVVDSVEDNRIMVYFPGKPNEEIRGKLKANGFRWAPSTGAWQGFRSPYRLQNVKEIVAKA